MDKYTQLIPGTLYNHTNGDQYKCLKSYTKFEAVLERASDGWTLNAHGTRMTGSGTIHWNYSTGGHWERLIYHGTKGDIKKAIDETRGSN